jgi:hypothetical protein
VPRVVHLPDAPHGHANIKSNHHNHPLPCHGLRYTAHSISHRSPPGRLQPYGASPCAGPPSCSGQFLDAACIETTVETLACVTPKQLRHDAALSRLLCFWCLFVTVPPSITGPVQARVIISVHTPSLCHDQGFANCAAREVLDEYPSMRAGGVTRPPWLDRIKKVTVTCEL